MLKLAPILSVMSAWEICHGPCFNFIYGWFFTIEASLIVEDFTISVFGSSCKYLFCSYCSLKKEKKIRVNQKRELHELHIIRKISDFYSLTSDNLFISVILYITNQNARFLNILQPVKHMLQYGYNILFRIYSLPI